MTRTTQQKELQRELAEASIVDLVASVLEQPVTVEKGSSESISTAYALKIDWALRTGGHVVTSEEPLRQILQIVMKENRKLREQAREDLQDLAQMEQGISELTKENRKLQQQILDLSDAMDSLEGELSQTEASTARLSRSAEGLRQDRNQLYELIRYSRLRYSRESSIFRETIRQVRSETLGTLVKTSRMKRIAELVSPERIFKLQEEAEREAQEEMDRRKKEEQAGV